MSNRLTQSLSVAAILFGSAFATSAPADVLLVDRAQDSLSMPSRGMSMAQVERRFGAPLVKLDPRGGDAPTHPVINRWEYENYIVYFERQSVIDTVAKRSTPLEGDVKRN
jgi:hypothetical protein